MRSNGVHSLRGFTLIEVLVAFSITTLALGVIFQIYAKGAAATVLANEYAHALAIAESKLAGAAVDIALHRLEKQGTELDKYDWELRVEDYLVESWSAVLPSSYSLMSVNVDVSWESRGRLREINLQTLIPVTAK